MYSPLLRRRVKWKWFRDFVFEAGDSPEIETYLPDKPDGATKRKQKYRIQTGNCISSFEHVSFCSYAESIKTTDQNIKIHPLQYLWSLLYCQINAGVNNAYNGICRLLYIRVHRVQYVLAYGMARWNREWNELVTHRSVKCQDLLLRCNLFECFSKTCLSKYSFFFFSLFLFLLFFLFNTRFLTGERLDKKNMEK